MGAAAHAQYRPLNKNKGNNGGYSAKSKAYPKQTLYSEPFFSDAPTTYPNKLLKKPFTQMNYDYSKRLHFGFALAVGTLDYKIISSPNPTYSSKNPTPNNFFVDVTNLTPSMGVAAVMDWRLSHNLSLRAQLGPTFGSRKVNFFESTTDSLSLSMELESVVLDLPILLKYRAFRHSDVRPFLIAGLTPSCDVGAFNEFNEGRQVYIATKPFDLAYTIGGGFDVYAEFFKFSVELKYVAGVINSISRKSLDGLEQYPNAIEKMYARTIVLSFIFE